MSISPVDFIKLVRAVEDLTKAVRDFHSDYRAVHSARPTVQPYAVSYDGTQTPSAPPR